MGKAIGIARGVGRTCRGVVLSFALAAPALASGGVYQEDGGLVVVEMESPQPGGDWRVETQHAGHTGSGYLRWDGPDSFGVPGLGTFAIEFDVHQAGLYHFRLRNRHEHADSTEENDVWVRLDGGTWIKTFSGVAHQWTWSTYHELSESDKPPASYQLAAGHHVLEFSGRSHNFMIDRMHLYRDGHADGQNPASPESASIPSVQENRPPVPRLRIDPPAIPENDGRATVITLRAADSFDPDDGQQLAFHWQVRGATFVQGTGAHSPEAKVVLPGGRVWPVKLTVTDDGQPALSTTVHGAINVSGSAGSVSGEPVAWHTIELAFRGPTASETDEAPNPFLDYRLIVTFTGARGQQYRVHGFFDGDGAGSGTGDVWKVRFTPDAGGVWQWQASFRQKPGVAIMTNPNQGTPLAFDGASGEIIVLNRDPQAPGFLAQGRLEYVGEHYLKFRDGGFFIKGGTDSPENFLGYAGFDDVQDHGGAGIVHTYAPHVGDWQPGDPHFVSSTTGVDSKGIIGALNYLSSRHVNSVYFLPMNLGGDGQETCPFVGYSNTGFDKLHYDISRLEQWFQVFEHAQRRGILLHFVLAETEDANENWLDGGQLGAQRKLFFRELVARFGHVLALKWNLSEENDFPIERLTEFADYLGYLDPYDHPIAVHTHPNNFQDYEALLGDPRFSASSIQYDPNLAQSHVEQWRLNTAQAGRKWVLDMDENNPWYDGLTNSNADDLRKRVLYDVLLSGGQIEWYAGYHDLPLGGDLRLEDFRTRQAMWDYMWYARRMLQAFPFQEMEPRDDLLSQESSDYGGGEVLAKPGQVYVVYLPKAQNPGAISLTNGSGAFRGRWFDPRAGRYEGARFTLQGGGVRELPLPPSNPQEDWVFVLQKQGPN